MDFPSQGMEARTNAGRGAQSSAAPIFCRSHVHGHCYLFERGAKGTQDALGRLVRVVGLPVPGRGRLGRVFLLNIYVSIVVLCFIVLRVC